MTENKVLHIKLTLCSLVLSMLLLCNYGQPCESHKSPLSKIILKEFKEGGINCDIDESTI